ncbi:MAG: hypothetical protein GWP04_02610 [Gammaproteobacteria bacterium]|nr:hypothetical protein [Gammaproteobacteria bacterium]
MPISTPMGGIVMRFPTAQADAAREARETCAGLSLQPDSQRPTDLQLRDLYDRYLEKRNCLEADGYAIEAPPSVDEFVETYFTDPWLPYNSIPKTLDQREWDRLNRVCPQP